MPPVLIPSPPWMRQAVCRDADPQEFRPDQPKAEAARAIRRWCQHCPVVVECRVDAEAGEEEGVWGAEYRTQQHDGPGRARAFTLAELETRWRRSS